jgi:hypothetical protein
MLARRRIRRKELGVLPTSYGAGLPQLIAHVEVGFQRVVAEQFGLCQQHIHCQQTGFAVASMDVASFSGPMISSGPMINSG